MKYWLAKKWNLSRTRNGIEYLYTYDSKLNLKPLFLKNEYIEQIKSIGTIVNEKLLNNLLLLGLIESTQQKKHIISDREIPNHIRFLYSQAFYSRTPIECKVELTYNCNLRCRFCLEKGLTTFSVMSIDEIEDVFNQLRELGVVKLFLTGGEIFILPEIMKIIDLACRLNFLVILQTNATLLNENIIEELSVYKNLRLNISFHGADADIFNYFVQKIGTYEKVVVNLELLAKYSVKTLLIYNVTKYNHQIYDKTIQWFFNHNYDYQVNYEIYPNLLSGQSNSEFVAFDTNYSKYLREKYKFYDESNFENTVCDAAITKLRISPEGHVFPCGLIRKSLGNTKEQRIDSIWENKTAKEIISNDIQRIRPGCKNCKYTKFCSKCNAMLINGNWENSKPQYCYKAKELYKIYEENYNEYITY